MPIETIIFDWSGVLSDDFTCVLDTLNAMLAEYDKTLISGEYLREHFAADPMDFWRELGITVSREEIQERYDRNYNGKMPEPIGSGKNVLPELVNMAENMMILSTHPQQFLGEEVKSFGYSSYFKPEHIFGGVHRKKDFLPELIEKLGLKKSMTFFIGDTAGDIVAGKIAGVLTGGILTGYHSRKRIEEANPDEIFENLYDFLNYVRYE